MTGTSPFPQRALLTGVLWFPATFLVLWACSALGWWSSRHMEFPLVAFFATLFLLMFLMQIQIIRRALTAFRLYPDTRLPINYLLFAIGVLTAILAAGFTAVFVVIAFNG
jgi:hypothetical protein